MAFKMYKKSCFFFSVTESHNQQKTFADNGVKEGYMCGDLNSEWGTLFSSKNLNVLSSKSSTYLKKQYPRNTNKFVNESDSILKEKMIQHLTIAI